MRYLIVSYRENGVDTCMGCIMDGTDSELTVEDITSRDEAVRHLATLIFKEKVLERGLKWGTRETQVFVNGVSLQSEASAEAALDSEEQREVDAAKAEITALYTEAEAQYVERYAAHTKAEEEKAERQRMEEEEHQRQADLRQLDVLRKRLGVD